MMEQNHSFCLHKFFESSLF